MGLVWRVPAWEAPRGTVSHEHPWEVMSDLGVYGGPDETEKEELAAAGKAVTKEGFQGERTAPAPELTAAHPAVADSGVLVPCAAVQVPTAAWSPQPAIEDRAAAPTTQVGTTTE